LILDATVVTAVVDTALITAHRDQSTQDNAHKKDLLHSNFAVTAMTSFLCFLLALSLANAVRVTPCMNINGNSTFNLASNLGWSVTFRLNSSSQTGVVFSIFNAVLGLTCMTLTLGPDVIPGDTNFPLPASNAARYVTVVANSTLVLVNGTPHKLDVSNGRVCGDKAEILLGGFKSSFTGPCLEAMPAAADIEQFRLFPFTLATTELAMLNTSTSVSGCIEMEAHGSGVATLFPCPARVDALCRRLRCPNCQSTPACRSCTDFQCSAKDGTCPKATDCKLPSQGECATFVDHCKNMCGGDKAGICDCGASDRFVSCPTSDCASPVLFATCSSECPQGIQECNCVTNRVLCQPKNEILTAASTAIFVPPPPKADENALWYYVGAGSGALTICFLVVLILICYIMRQRRADRIHVQKSATEIQPKVSPSREFASARDESVPGNHENTTQSHYAQTAVDFRIEEPSSNYGEFTLQQAKEQEESHYARTGEDFRVPDSAHYEMIDDKDTLVLVS
jgi:hypothetical protein